MRRITFAVFPGYSVMALAMVTAFESANEVVGQAVYEASFISETGGLVRTSSGLSVDTGSFDAAQGDTLVVGGASVPQPSTGALVDFLRSAPQRFRRIASTCTGAFALAEAGLLDDRRATTHWLYARELKARFPNVRVDEDIIFINDGMVWTSAGMSAGIDLALALIETDFSPEVARTVVVAEMTGFADPDRMRRAFLRAFGQPPQVIRRTARLGSTQGQEVRDTVM